MDSSDVFKIGGRTDSGHRRQEIDQQRKSFFFVDFSAIQKGFSCFVVLQLKGVTTAAGSCAIFRMPGSLTWMHPVMDSDLH